MRLILALAVLLTPALATANGKAAQSPMPKTLWVEPQTREFPSWVEASEALTPDGQVAENLFYPGTANAISRLLATPERDGCIRMEEIYYQWVNPPDRASVTKATRTSELIILGEVVGRSYGFGKGDPGQLLRIKKVEVLKGGPEAREEYYVFIPIGTFRLGGKLLCKTDRRYAEPPEIGDSVLLFVPEHYRDDEEYLNIFDEHGLVTLKRGGEAKLPRGFAEQSQIVRPLQRQEVLGAVRAALREERQP